jgi:hypothetical protein
LISLNILNIGIRNDYGKAEKVFLKEIDRTLAVNAACELLRLMGACCVMEIHIGLLFGLTVHLDFAGLGCLATLQHAKKENTNKE